MNIHGVYILQALALLACYWVGVGMAATSTRSEQGLFDFMALISILLHLVTGGTIIYHIILACTA